VGPTWQRCERGNTVDGLRKLEEEVHFGKYAKAAQVEWTERTHDGLRAKRLGLLGGWAGWARIRGKIISE
jgi:hypothetical protein